MSIILLSTCGLMHGNYLYQSHQSSRCLEPMTMTSRAARSQRSAADDDHCALSVTRARGGCDMGHHTHHCYCFYCCGCCCCFCGSISSDEGSMLTGCCRVASMLHSEEGVRPLTALINVQRPDCQCLFNHMLNNWYLVKDRQSEPCLLPDAPCRSSLHAMS